MNKEQVKSSITSHESFKNIFIEVLTKHSTLRKKFLRANHVPYMSKTLSKTFIRRSQLETKHLKTRAQTELEPYK